MESKLDIDKKDKTGKVLKTIWEYMGMIVLSVVFALIISQFMRFATVVGHSMDNTLFDNEKLLVNTHIYKNELPKHGEIIVAERKDLSIRYFIKRVIAVEGDTIEIKNCVTYLNGEALEEDFTKEPMFTEDMPEITIPKGKIFVMGDNRNNSMDSRSNIIGLIDIENELVGKAFFSISEMKKL